MRTKSRIGMVMAAAVLMLAARPGVAGIAGSAHDFTTSASGNWSGGRICVACHTPHKSDQSTVGLTAPLWNHAQSAVASYTVYSSATMKGTAGQPGNTSKLCLSCHDGTVALDSFGNSAAAGTSGFTAAAGTGLRVKSENNLNNSASLQDDHPVGIDYAATLALDATRLNPTSTAVTLGSTGSGYQQDPSATVAKLLYSGKVECSSCHDVHNVFTVPNAGVGTSGGLVKMGQSGSTASTNLCLSCHNK